MFVNLSGINEEEAETLSGYVLNYGVPGSVPPEIEPVISDLLDDQPGSYSSYFTKDEVMSRITRGIFVPWLYIKNNECVGMLITSLHKYSDTVTSIKYEFLSCRSFFSMMEISYEVEKRARESGITYIEAFCPPALAEYACRKQGFDVEGLLIRKTLDHTRRN